MLQKRFVIGSINQGRASVNGVFSAYEQNTIFYSDVCTAEDFLDEPHYDPEARAFLKSIGSLVLTVCSVTSIDNKTRIAQLEMDEDSQLRYQKAMDFLFRNNIIGYFHQDPPLMTMTEMTALEVGNQLSIGYFSIMEPIGEGEYRLKHDYQIQRPQGHRFEHGDL